MRPLSGIRIVDFTAMIAGPYCTRLLADCGAEVIKVEPPGGDHMRRVPPQRGGHSSYFGHLNCGKRSVVLDLKSAPERLLARRLALSADVVVENFRPGVMAGLELGYRELSATRPDLIYCAISGFGQFGPRAQQPAYAPIVHAASGYDLAQLEYQDELTGPEKSGIFYADVLASVYGFGAIQTALIGKFRHGAGQFIDVALMDCMINLLIGECQAAQFPNERPRNLFLPTRASDGFVMVCPITVKNVESVARTMGHPEWLDDPRFDTVEARRAHWREWYDCIEAWTEQRTARECEDILMAGGVPCSRYRTVGEAMDDAQTQARGLFATVNDAGGPFKVSNPPFQFADGTIGAGAECPALGQHTEDVKAEIAELERAG